MRYNQLTTESFIQKAKDSHKDTYDYSKAVYKGTHSKIEIICKIHGSFFQDACTHIRGTGCPICGRILSSKNKIEANNKKILNVFYTKHKNTYDYSRFVYRGNKIPSIIICKKHGEFLQNANNHKNGKGCPTCAIEKRKENIKWNFNDLLSEIRVLYNERFFVCISEPYDSVNQKVKCKCRKHNYIFERSFHVLLRGTGCKFCKADTLKIKRKSNMKELIYKIRTKYPENFAYMDFSESIYVSAKNKINVFCRRCYNHYSITPNSLLNGIGCPICNLSKGEKIINEYLKRNNIEYARQYKHKKCTYNKELPFDFAVYNKGKLTGLIEYQGIQHYESVSFFGGETVLKKQILKDQIKKEFSQKHKIPLLEISYIDKTNIHHLLNDFLFCIEIY